MTWKTSTKDLGRKPNSMHEPIGVKGDTPTIKSV